MADPNVERLRSAGLRVTAPRLAVLDVLDGEAHASAETLAARVRERLGSLSTQAVYDNLQALERAGLVRRIEPAHGPALYETRVGDNHHHLICRRCRSAVDVDCVLGAPPCISPVDTHGFEIDEAEIVFWGLCPACRSKQ